MQRSPSNRLVALRFFLDFGLSHSLPLSQQNLPQPEAHMLLLLLACRAPAEPIDTGVDEPTPYIYEDAETVEASMTADDIGQAISALLEDTLQIHASPVFDSYDAIMTAQEPDCPNYYENEGNLYWYDYCYSSDGSYFTGYAFSLEYEDYPAEGYVYNGRALNAVAEVSTGEGHLFSAGGTAQFLRADSTEEAHDVQHIIWYSVIQGSYAYDGPEAAGTWLNEGISPDLTLQIAEIPEEAEAGVSGRTFTADGGVSGLSGDIGTFLFDAFQVWPAEFGNSCPEEPHGMISVRDEDGLWYDVVFDGSEPWSSEPV